MPDTPHIIIIIASTRTARFADHPLTWLLAETDKHTEFSFEVLDLRDNPLPYFDRAASPGMKPRAYGSDVEKAIGVRLDSADGFLVITNEYNHGYNAALKNLLDHYFAEWNRKPMSFIGYGNAGAARAIEQLRQVAAELELASVRPTVNILGPHIMGIRGGADPAETLAPLEPRLDALLADLHWWATALAVARKADLDRLDADPADA